MPFQAWICCGHALMLVPAVWLQWGHAFSGMDILPASILSRPATGGFNGAMPFQAWISAKRGISALAIAASMGPCLFRHGYAETFYDRTTPLDASMGPCLFRHGYWTDGISTRIRSASMGPCPFRHGYYAETLFRTGTTELQWGHALSSMDTKDT